MRIHTDTQRLNAITGGLVQVVRPLLLFAVFFFSLSAVTFTQEAIKSALKRFGPSVIVSPVLVFTMQLHVCESVYALKN